MLGIGPVALHTLVHLNSTMLFILQRSKSVVLTKTIWFTKPKISGPFQIDFAAHCGKE